MTKELVIRYQDYEGNITERHISDLVLESSRAIDAYCHLRKGRRSFVFDRITSAYDAKTGEVIENISELFGVQQSNKPQAIRSKRTSDYTLQDGELYKSQRDKQKYEFAKPYYARVIYELYKQRLFDMFDQRCFKCGAPPPLVFDHHIPIVLGGILAPGNIVALCRQCNGAKHDKPPQLFYTEDELQRLQPILDRQESVLDFTLNWDAWRTDRKHYLQSLGIDSALVDEVLFNPDHPWYVGAPSDRKSLEMKIRLTENDDA